VKRVSAEISGAEISGSRDPATTELAIAPATRAPRAESEPLYRNATDAVASSPARRRLVWRRGSSRPAGTTPGRRSIARTQARGRRRGPAGAPRGAAGPCFTSCLPDWL